MDRTRGQGTRTKTPIDGRRDSTAEEGRSSMRVQQETEEQTVDRITKAAGELLAAMFDETSSYKAFTAQVTEVIVGNVEAPMFPCVLAFAFARAIRAINKKNIERNARLDMLEAAGIRYAGPIEAGKAYTKGDIVISNGSSWLALE